MAAAVTLFVSYPHDSAAHREWVLDLATDLRAAGVDAILDQWDLKPGQGISIFMQRGRTFATRGSRDHQGVER